MHSKLIKVLTITFFIFLGIIGFLVGYMLGDFTRYKLYEAEKIEKLSRSIVTPVKKKIIIMPDELGVVVECGEDLISTNG